MSENNQPVIKDENSIILERRAKLKELREKGVAFPNQFAPDAFARKLHQDYDGLDKEALEEKSMVVSIAGRMMLKRVMGKASFATIQDSTGRIQLYVSRDLINNEANPDLYSSFKRWDLGDILWAKGTLFKTKTNELSLYVTEINLLTKSLRPLP